MKRFRANCIDARTYKHRFLIWDGKELSDFVTTGYDEYKRFTESLKEKGFIQTWGKVSD